MTEDAEDKINSLKCRLYLSLYRTFANVEEDSYYFGYKKLLLANIGILDKGEISFHLTRLLRYCMLKKDKNELGL
jgi:hypothetical protein